MLLYLEAHGLGSIPSLSPLGGCPEPQGCPGVYSWKAQPVGYPQLGYSAESGDILRRACLLCREQPSCPGGLRHDIPGQRRLQQELMWGYGCIFHEQGEGRILFIF